MDADPNRVIEAGGGTKRVAEALGVRPQVVSNWRRRNVIPAERVLALEAVTGVSRHVIRPDIYPPPDPPVHERPSTEAA